MKKALIITNTASMVHLFNGVNIDILQDAGYEVHIACNFHDGNTASESAIEDYKKVWEEKGIVSHHIGFLRSPFSLKSFSLYRETKKLIRKGKFDIIHCHTPIVSVFTRLAAQKLRREYGAKVIYTAHGFHFYKGCPAKNWILYFGIEKALAHMTDLLITINREDYDRAIKYFRAKKIIYTNGVGIDIDQINSCECHRTDIRSQLGILDDDIMLTSVGELNNNKNHIKAIEAISRCKNKNIHYVVCGIGYAKEKLLEASREFGVENRLHLLGFRKDVLAVLKSSDIFIFPSIREGLSVALMEAMAAGLPIIASKIRGNIDLIVKDKGGFLCERFDALCFANAIDMLSSDGNLRKNMGEYNKNKIKAYDKKIVYEQLSKALFDSCEWPVYDKEGVSVEV